LLYARNKQHFKDNGIKWREAKPGASEILSEYLSLRDSLGDDDAAVEQGIRNFYANLPQAHPSKKHSRYNKVDAKGVWRDDNMSWPGGGGPTYDVIHPETGMPCAVPEGGWRYSTLEKMQEMIDSGKVVFRQDHTEPPIRKTYLVQVDEDQDEEAPEAEGDDDIPIQVAGSYFYRSGLQASNELADIFGARVFNNPKDREVIERWIEYVAPSKGDIILDFFAGSGTTAHAVMNMNAEKNLGLRFIAVQLPEEIDPKGKGAKPALEFLNCIGKPSNVAELTKERLRRVASRLRGESGSKELQHLLGFRVLKVDSSNMTNAFYRPEETDQSRLIETVESIKPDRRNPEDLLFQVLIDWGVDLTLPISKQEISGKTVFFVNEEPYDLIACFDYGVTEELVKELAKHEPARVVFRDNGFASDAVKINVEQIFKQLSPATDVKSI